MFKTLFLATSLRAGKFKKIFGVVAQLVRAPPCHGGGCGFEPRQLRHLILNYYPQIFQCYQCSNLRKINYPTDSVTSVISPLKLEN